MRFHTEPFFLAPNISAWMSPGTCQFAVHKILNGILYEFSKHRGCCRCRRLTCFTRLYELGNWELWDDCCVSRQTGINNAVCTRQINFCSSSSDSVHELNLYIQTTYLLLFFMRLLVPKSVVQSSRTPSKT